jgi:predicted Zn-dependent protease
MGMPSFFEVLAREAGNPDARAPEFLQTHPLSSARVAETRDRAERVKPREISETPTYELMRARIRALNARSAAEALGRFSTQGSGPDDDLPATRYGYALALMRAGRYADAVPILQRLRDEDEPVVVFHSALGEALMLANRPEKSLAVFEKAIRLSPRNRPLTVRYAESLIRARKFDVAHTVLLDLFNNVRPTPPQVRLIANAADAAGQTAEALFYMSEYHLLTGQLPMAVDKLKLALLEPGLQPLQRARFEARIAELEPYLAQQRAARPKPGQRRQ